MLQKLKNLYILAIISFAILSCQKELSLNIPESLPPGTGAACKSCSYIPFCDSSNYTYIDTMGGIGTPAQSIIDILKDTLIDGKIFQKFANPGADGFYNCSAGVSTVIAYNVPSSGGPVMKVEQTLLKANEPVGSTWRNTIDNGLGQLLDYDSKIIAKGLTRTVLGVNYTDVIQVHQTVSITVPVGGTQILLETDNYYANHIGLIDNITFSVSPFLPPMMTLHRVLQSYFIP